MAPTCVIAQLSDMHVRAGAEGDPMAVALDAAVATVLALPRPPDAVLLSGDVGDPGSADDYARVRASLAPLPMPVHVMPGNHDDRAGMRAAFDLPDDELIQYAARVGPLRLVCCDTIKAGEDDGAYPPDRLDWLRATLRQERDTPTIVALHHPPVPTGVDQLDTVGLDPDDARALAALLHEHPQVKRVVAGHYHRAVVGEIGDRPYMTCPSTYLQADLDLRPGGEIALVDEPPAILLHAWLGDQLVTHVHPIG